MAMTSLLAIDSPVVEAPGAMSLVEVKPQLKMSTKSAEYEALDQPPMHELYSGICKHPGEGLAAADDRHCDPEGIRDMEECRWRTSKFCCKDF